jgi:hypothetical protein
VCIDPAPGTIGFAGSTGEVRIAVPGVCHANPGGTIVFDGRPDGPLVEVPLNDTSQVTFEHTSGNIATPCGSHNELQDLTTLVVRPTGGYPAIQAFSYSILMPFGSLLDRNDVPLLALSIERGAAKFTVEDAHPPAIIAIEPMAAATGIPLLPIIVLTVDEPVVISPDLISVDFATNTAVQFAPIMAAVDSDGSGDGSASIGSIVNGNISAIETVDGVTRVSIVTLGTLATAQGGQPYTLTISAGTLLDLVGLPMSQTLIGFTTVDLVPPAVFSTHPTQGAVVLLGSTSIEVEFDEEIVAGNSSADAMMTITSKFGAAWSPARISLQQPTATEDSDVGVLIKGNALSFDLVALLSTQIGGMRLFDAYTIGFEAGAIVDTAKHYEETAVANQFVVADAAAGALVVSMTDSNYFGKWIPESTGANMHTFLTVEVTCRYAFAPKSTLTLVLPPLPSSATADNHGFVLDVAEIRRSLTYTVSPQTSGIWVMHGADSEAGTISLRFESQRALPSGTTVVATFGGVQMPNVLGELGASTLLFEERYGETTDVFLNVSPGIVITNDLAPVFVGAPIAVVIVEDDALTADRAVLTVQAVDPDAVPGAGLTFAILSQTPAAQDLGTFAIDKDTGVLSVSGAIDFEAFAPALPHILIVVEVNELIAPFLSTNTTVVVNVEDVNDNAPTFVLDVHPEHGYWFALHENVTGGTVAGSIQGTDVDSPLGGNVLNYSWVSAAAVDSDAVATNETTTSGGAFKLDTTSGEITVTALDGLAEFGPVVQYDVTVMDQGGLSTTTPLSMFVLDETVLASIILQPAGINNETTLDMEIVGAALSAAMGTQRTTSIAAVTELPSGAFQVDYYVASFGVSATGERTIGMLSETTIATEILTPAALAVLSEGGLGAFEVVPDTTEGDPTSIDTVSSKMAEELIAGVAAAAAVFVLMVSLIVVVVVKRRRNDDGSKYIYNSNENDDRISGMVMHVPGSSSAYMDVQGDPRSSMFGPRVASSMIPGLIFDTEGNARSSMVGGNFGGGQQRTSMLPARPSHAAPPPPKKKKKKKKKAPQQQQQQQGAGRPSEGVVSGLTRQASAGYLDLGSPMSAANTMYEGDDGFFAPFFNDAAATDGGPDAAPRRVSSNMSAGTVNTNFGTSANLGMSNNSNTTRWSDQPAAGRANELGWGTHGAGDNGNIDGEEAEGNRNGNVIGNDLLGRAPEDNRPLHTPSIELGDRFTRRASNTAAEMYSDDVGAESQPMSPMNPLAEFFGTSSASAAQEPPSPTRRDSVRSSVQLSMNPVGYDDDDGIIPPPIRANGRGARASTTNMNLASGEGSSSNLGGGFQRTASARTFQANQLL